MSRFSGHRIYNSCHDSELQAKWDYEASLMDRLKKICPSAICTWHPMEQGYTVGTNKAWGKYTAYDSLLPNFELIRNKVEAVLKAINILEAEALDAESYQKPEIKQVICGTKADFIVVDGLDYLKESEVKDER